MRRLTCLTIPFLLLLTATLGCRQTQADRYERYLESLADSSGMEFITPASDTVQADETDIFLGGDDDGLVAIPDIPQERGIDMSASNYDLEKVMMGRE